MRAGEVAGEATVEWRDLLPSAQLSVTVTPTSLAEPGGSVTWTVRVTNGSEETATMTALSDPAGSLQGRGTCEVPQQVEGFASYTCTFSEEISGTGGQAYSRSFAAKLADDDGNHSTDDFTAKLEILAVVQPEPPVATITRAPDAVTSSRTATFAFTADQPGATFECALDDGPLTGCVMPVSYHDLGEGDHRFVVRAIGPAGAGRVAEHTWTIEARTPPPRDLYETPGYHDSGGRQ